MVSMTLVFHCPIVARTGAPKAPTRKQITYWVVKSWNLVTEDLV